MDTDLDRLFRYITLGLAAVATVFFIVLGIAQREFLLGVVWAAVASLVLWILVLIAKHLIVFIQTKRSTARLTAEATENDEA